MRYPTRRQLSGFVLTGIVRFGGGALSQRPVSAVPAGRAAAGSPSKTPVANAPSNTTTIAIVAWANSSFHLTYRPPDNADKFGKGYRGSGVGCRTIHSLPQSLYRTSRLGAHFQTPDTQTPIPEFHGNTCASASRAASVSRRCGHSGNVKRGARRAAPRGNFSALNIPSRVSRTLPST